MAIQPPKWASQCVPTTKGWQDPKTGEILVGGSISNAAIAEWHEARAPKPAPKAKAKPKAKPQTLKESPTTEEEFVDEVMTEDEDELLTEEPKSTLW